MMVEFFAEMLIECLFFVVNLLVTLATENPVGFYLAFCFLFTACPLAAHAFYLDNINEVQHRTTEA